MIRLVIFDIDGVLVSTKKLHEIAFIKSLNKYGISITSDEHKLKFDGLPTKKKLEILNISKKDSEHIFNLKQKLTFELANGHISTSPEIKKIFQYLQENNIKIAICSNSIRQFCELVVNSLDIKYDLLLSSEDVTQPKPSPEIYNMAMKFLNISPAHTLIFEDSKFGIEAATNSNANLCIIQDPNFLTLNKVKLYLSTYNGG